MDKGISSKATLRRAMVILRRGKATLRNRDSLRLLLITTPVDYRTKALAAIPRLIGRAVAATSATDLGSCRARMIIRRIPLTACSINLSHHRSTPHLMASIRRTTRLPRHMVRPVHSSMLPSTRMPQVTARLAPIPVSLSPRAPATARKDSVRP